MHRDTRSFVGWIPRIQVTQAKLQYCCVCLCVTMNQAFTGWKQEHTDKTEGASILENYPAVSEKHFTLSNHVHEPGLNSISQFIMAALLFVSAIFLPFTLTSSQVCMSFMWTYALWRFCSFSRLKEQIRGADPAERQWVFCCALRENYF